MHTREIHKAVKNQNVKKVSQIIAEKINKEKRYSIDVIDEYGCTPLIWACGYSGYGGNLEIVKLLVEAGADINFTNNKGNTPLYLASSWGHTKVVEYLLLKVNDIDRINNEGDTTLAIACENKNMAIIKLLLEHGADPNNIKPSIYGKLNGDVIHLLNRHNQHQRVATSQPTQTTTITSPSPTQTTTKTQVYSTPIVSRTFYAPPHHHHNNYAANMKAEADVINAVANFEQGLATDLNAINNFNL